MAVSAAVLTLAALALLASWAFSRETTIAGFEVRGAANGLDLDVRGGSVVIIGGGQRTQVRVRRTERHAFGQKAVTTRAAPGGVVRLATRCPRAVLAACSTDYVVVVPDNLPLTVRTDGGDVRFDRFRGSARVATDSGDVDITGFCGFSLRAATGSGDVHAAAVCPPERLQLRSRTGNVTADVPGGRYRVDAETDGGRRTVRGVLAEDDAPFQIQALSDSGDVSVTGAR